MTTSTITFDERMSTLSNIFSKINRINETLELPKYQGARYTERVRIPRGEALRAMRTGYFMDANELMAK